MIRSADVARTLRISPATLSRATSRAVVITHGKHLQDKRLSDRLENMVKSWRKIAESYKNVNM